MIGTNNRESGLLNLYFQDVADSKPLTSDREVALAERIAAGDDEARNELVRANLRFVIKIAVEYQKSGVPLEDLISAGNLGLITAAERFDASRGFRFITYAVWWIRQSISQVQSQCSRMVRLPSNRIKLLSSINDLSQRLFQDKGTEPEPVMIAEELGISEDLVRDTMLKARDVWYMDSACQDHEDKDPLHVIPDTTQEAPDAQVEEQSDREQVQMVLDTLEDRESEILRLHFGMGEDDPMTLEEIGSRFSITKERVRQIKEKALCKLRHPVRRMQLDPVQGY